MIKAKITLLCLVVIALLLISGVAYAQTSGYALNWWTVDGGGGHSTGSGYQLNGTIGQADAGAMNGSGYRLKGGFWGGGENAASGHEIFLPVVVK